MNAPTLPPMMTAVSVLNREPMWLKSRPPTAMLRIHRVSVLNREPMWLKFVAEGSSVGVGVGFSAQP